MIKKIQVYPYTGRNLPMGEMELLTKLNELIHEVNSLDSLVRQVVEMQQVDTMETMEEPCNICGAMSNKCANAGEPKESKESEKFVETAKIIAAKNQAIAQERERIVEEISSVPLCGLDLESLIQIVRDRKE